jgi:lysine 2,3-aminomutase
MQSETSFTENGEPPSGSSIDSLKKFHSAGRGFWRDVPDADWNDWKWQLKHRITNAEQLQKFLPTLTPEEFAGAKLANTKLALKLALAITPYFFNLIDPADENCPIRLQVIPKLAESHTAPWEMSDPVGEDSHSPVPGLVHRYPDRVLFLVTDRCAAYRFSSGIRQADRLHRRAPGNPRRALERRRPAALE